MRNDNAPAPEEEVFKVRGGRWFLRMMGFYPPARIPLTVAGIASLLLTVAGIIFDLRLVIVALMVVMLVVPMLCALLFFNYGLLPVNSLNMTLHRIRSDNGSIIVEIMTPLPAEREGKETEAETPETDGELRLHRTVRIPAANVVSHNASEIIIKSGGRQQLLLLPVRPLRQRESSSDRPATTDKI
ncbi:MAG: hypothetical protein HDS26_06055 [Bacteroides sp.]|nr:hypothetical protein [Bacteroides sp.]